MLALVRGDLSVEGGDGDSEVFGDFGGWRAHRRASYQSHAVVHALGSAATRPANQTCGRKGQAWR